MSTIGYFQGSQKRFSLEESTAKLIKAIDECNKSTITTATIQPLYDPHHKIIPAIKLGIDGPMGSDTSNLILKTRKIIYCVDEQCISRQPRLFVDTLVKLLGDNITHEILTVILSKMRNPTNRESI